MPCCRGRVILRDIPLYDLTDEVRDANAFALQNLLREARQISSIMAEQQHQLASQSDMKAAIDTIGLAVERGARSLHHAREAEQISSLAVQACHHTTIIDLHVSVDFLRVHWVRVMDYTAARIVST